MTTVAIPDSLGAQLQAVADRTGRSRDEYAAEAIANLLEDMEDVAVATERLQQRERTISLDELRKNLGLDD